MRGLRDWGDSGSKGRSDKMKRGREELLDCNLGRMCVIEARKETSVRVEVEMVGPRRVGAR